MSDIFFNLDFESDENSILIKIKGRLVFPEADYAEGAIVQEITKNKKDVIFDFSECKFIASSGYAIFIRIKKECDEQGLNIAFACCNDTVKRGFFVIGYQNIVKFFDTIEQAKKYLETK